MQNGLGAFKARIAEVVDVVCAGEGVKWSDMKTTSRRHDIAHPRQIAMALSRELTGHSYPTIGRHFGDRDHTTVLFAARKIERLERDDPKAAAKIDAYRQKIRDIVLARSPAPVPTLADDVAEANALLCAGDASNWTPKPPEPRPLRRIGHGKALTPQRLARAVDEAAWLGLGGELEAAA